MKPVIAIDGLTKRFGGKTAVDGLSLEVPKGAIFALLGDNGAGKTTTIRVLAGLLRPDGGRAQVLGRDAWQAAQPLRHEVGYVPERPKFYDWMTVAEVGWFAAGFHKPGFLDHYHKLLDRYRLDAKARLQNLSKGQYAKVALALALAHKPDVLLLDEPLSGLDLQVRQEVLASLVKQAGKGRTVVISSHNVAELERVASHVAFLEGGRLVLAAPLDELRRRLVRVCLRYEGRPPDAEALGRVLWRNGSGRQWQAVIQDPDRPAVEALRSEEGYHDVEETPLGLEEAYRALLGRKEEEL
jgi:ABC-2 type transport system ATP-binding protein